MTADVRTCDIEGCEREHYGHGYCRVHHRAWQVHGDPLHRERVVTEVCSVEGCGRRHRAWGYCAMHYERKKRTGDVGPVGRMIMSVRGRLCSVDGCGQPSHAKDLCDLHYRRQYRTGKVGPVHVIPRSERPRRDMRIRRPLPDKPILRLELAAPPPPGPLDMYPPRWPATDDPAACITALRSALHRCGGDNRAARRMLGIDLPTWDLWSYRARVGA